MVDIGNVIGDFSRGSFTFSKHFLFTSLLFPQLLSGQLFTNTSISSIGARGRR